MNARRGEAGKAYTFAAGVIDDVWGFDAAFFGITPREARQIDPQQRLMLQLAWEALEDAGIAPSTLARTSVGVYVGASSMDYCHRQFFDPAGTDSYLMTGNTLSLIANRISYIFNFNGPSLTIDTACSSSLVALDYALKDLQSGEIDIAIVGGVNCLLSPFNFIGFCAASMLSPDGLCRPFDHRANGYVRSEGGVAIVLQREDVAKDQGRGYAEVLACAMNCDGRTAGVALPSSAQQAALLHRIYDHGGIDPDKLAFVEAHGTGTLVGDPAEAGAIGAALGRRRAAPLAIGSAKSNVGHLEPASGLVGLLKAMLALEHGVLPATLHVEQLNPHIPFGDLNLEVATKPVTLDAREEVPLLAGINNFGFGGTNVHVVLSAVPGMRATDAIDVSPTTMAVRTVDSDAAPPFSLLLSAQSANALRAIAGAYCDLIQDPLQTPSGAALAEITRAAVHSRDLFRERLVAIADDAAGMTKALAAFAAGLPAPSVSLGSAAAQQAQTAFVFSGNGSQWPGMGRRAFRRSKRFRDSFRDVDASYRSNAGDSLEERLFADDIADQLRRTEVAQPLLFALQVALANSLVGSGLRPAAVLGHSVGEVAAAHICGALDLETAVRVVKARSRLQELTYRCGSMAAVQLSEDDLYDVIARHDLKGIEIAAVNSPRSVTVAGSTPEVERLLKVARAEQVVAAMLDIEYPFHSEFMEPVRAPLLETLSAQRSDTAQLKFYSTVTGDALDGTTLDAEYWWRNVREPVAFESAVRAAGQDGCQVFIEIGPRPVLRGYMTDTLGGIDAEFRVVATFDRVDGATDDADADGVDELTASLGRALVCGARFDAHQVFGSPVARTIKLPTYPWQNETFQFKPSAEALSIFDLGEEQHPLLGARLTRNDQVWEKHLDAQSAPYLSDHRIGNKVIMPGAGYVEMLLASSIQCLGTDEIELRDIDFQQALELTTASCQDVQTRVDIEGASIVISSRARLSADMRTVNVKARFADCLDVPPPTAIAPVCECADDARPLDRIYRLSERFGLNYGSSFQRVTACREIDEATIEVELSTALTGGSNNAADHVLHPLDLDAAFHGLNVIYDRLVFGERKLAYVPVRIGRLQLFKARARVRSARIMLHDYNNRAACADFELYGSDGGLVTTLTDVRFKAANIGRQASMAHSAYHVAGVRTCYADRFELLKLPTSGRIENPGEAANADDREPDIDVEHESALLCEVAARRIALDVLSEHADPSGQLSLGRLADHGAQTTARGLLGRLAEVELALSEPEGWRLQGEDELPTLADVIGEILRSAPDCIAECALLIRADRDLRDRLRSAGRGQIDAGGTPSESLNGALLDQFHGHSPSGRVLVPAVTRMLRDMIATWPQGRPVRVAQLGYVGGALTRTVTKLLDPDCASLVVVDDDAGAIARLKSTFGHLPHVTGHHLTGSATELDGLDTFDLLLSAGGLQHIGNVDTRLAALRQRISRGGAAIFALEAPSAFCDIVFAGHPGWFEEQPGHPFPISRQRKPIAWRQALAAAGWTVISSLGEESGEPGKPLLIVAHGGDANGTTVLDAHLGSPAAIKANGHVERKLHLVADSTAESVVATETQCAHHSVVLACASTVSSGQLMEEVAASLSRRGLGVRHWPIGDNASVELSATLQAEHSHPPVVVYFADSPSTCDDHDAERLASLLLQLKSILGALSVGGGRLLIVAPGGARAVVGLGKASPLATAIWSFGRTAINEHANVEITLIDWNEALRCDLLANRLTSLIAHPAACRELVLDRHAFVALQVRRGLRPSNEPTASSGSPAPIGDRMQMLEIRQQGNLDALSWSQGVRREPGADEVEIEVAASGLNFRDVMWALGLLPEEALEGGFAGPSLGLECSGRITRVGANVTGLRPGDAVMAMAPHAFSSHVTVGGRAVALVPSGVSLTAAATIPVAFLTSVYALEHLARLRAGEWVLIHGAAGGVGLAALQVAKSAGARIIATAGTDDKRSLLKMLGADHVFDSRSLTFVDDVRRLTPGGGVDVVLNSLAGEAMERSIELLRPFGRFLELGKRDFYANTKVGLRPFRRNVSYFAIDADQLLIHQPAVAQDVFERVSDGFERGLFTALPYCTFESGDVVEAFRLMQKSGHIGKIIVTPANDRNAVVVQLREFKPRASGTHLIVGGARGFGLEMAGWLAERGAQRIVVTSRSGGDPAQLDRVAEKLRAGGAVLEVVRCDVTDAAALNALLDRLRGEGPIAGVAHTAMVLDDCVIRNLTRDSLDRVLAPKVAGAYELDRLTRDDNLDYFVLFSSAAALFGNPGQASYVAANGYLDGLAQVRVASGRKAIAVAWGAIADAGVLTRQADKAASLARHGGYELTAREGLNLLAEILADEALHKASPNITLAAMNWSMASDFLPIMTTPAYDVMRRYATNAGERGGKSLDLRQAIAGLDDAAARDLIAQYVVGEVAAIFRMPAEDISIKRALADLGMDSLMGLELRMAAERNLGVDLPLVSISDGTTIHDIAASLLPRLRGEAAPESEIAVKREEILATHLAEEVDIADVNVIVDRVLTEKQRLDRVV